MNQFFSWFNLHRDLKALGATAYTEDEKKLPWAPQYLALLLGVVAQPFLKAYVATGQWNLDGFWPWVAASALLALIAFPGVYRSSFDPGKPLAVHLMVIFTSGFGWQALVGTAMKLGGNS